MPESDRRHNDQSAALMQVNALRCSISTTTDGHRRVRGASPITPRRLIPHHYPDQSLQHVSSIDRRGLGVNVLFHLTYKQLEKHSLKLI